MSKFQDRIQKAQAHMKKVQAKIADVAETAHIDAEIRKEEIADQIADVKGDVAAAQENIREASERGKSKFSADLLKAQMTLETAKDKIAEKKEEHDQEKQEERIADLLDYAEECQALAVALVAEAKLALLEATVEAADYAEEYGESMLP